MTYVSAQLAGGFRLIGASTTAYFTSVVLVGLAVPPSALRAYQLFSRDDNAWLELLAQLLRAALILAIITVARDRDVTSLLAGVEWRKLAGDMYRAIHTGWGAILIQVAVVTLVILAFNAALEALLNERSLRSLLITTRQGPASAQQAADAVIFFVKNVVVIPIYVMAILRSILAVHHPSSRS